MQLIYDNKLSSEIIFEKVKLIIETKNINIDEPNSILIKGDNFTALSLLLKNYSGKIDLIYIDPPFNTNQDFLFSNERANSISRKTEGIIAYSDKLSKDEYIEFIRERLFLLRELLSENGSIYLHIDYKIGHYVKVIMDEVFGENNFKNDITRIKSNPKNFFRKAYGNEKDLILFYTKTSNNIWNNIKIPMDSDEIIKRFPKIDEKGRRYTTIPMHAPGETRNGVTGQPWRNIPVPEGRHWRTDPKEFDKLDSEGMIEWSSKGNPRIKKYADEHNGKKIQDIWKFKDPQKPIYPTEKNIEMINQIILQSSNENSIVLDCFAGSGTTLESANKLNRKWIGIDNSSIAIDVIKTRNLTNYKLLDLNDIN